MTHYVLSLQADPAGAAYVDYGDAQNSNAPYVVGTAESGSLKFLLDVNNPDRRKLHDRLPSLVQFWYRYSGEALWHFVVLYPNDSKLSYPPQVKNSMAWFVRAYIQQGPGAMLTLDL